VNAGSGWQGHHDVWSEPDQWNMPVVTFGPIATWDWAHVPEVATGNSASSPSWGSVTPPPDDPPSSSTNCLAPVVAVVHSGIGAVKGFLFFVLFGGVVIVLSMFGNKKVRKGLKKS